MAGPLPNFQSGAGTSGGGQQGYQGIQGLMALLQGGLNQSQFTNLSNGYTGGNGYAVGGAHGAFAGLSPWAVHFLTNTPGIFNKTPTMAQQALTNEDGTPLTGSALLMATIHNSLAANGPSQYKLADGLGAGDIESMLKDYASSSGHNAYAKGFNEAGHDPTVVHGYHNPPHPWDAPKGVFGYGAKHGKPFHSEQAAKAAGRFHKGAPGQGATASGKRKHL